MAKLTSTTGDAEVLRNGKDRPIGITNNYGRLVKVKVNQKQRQRQINSYFKKLGVVN